MHEYDTYLAILDEAREDSKREDILLVGEGRFGPPDDSVRVQVNAVTDLHRLRRMVRHAGTARSWQEIHDTP